MRKKALLAVMMAMVLLLSGCALVVKDEAVDNAQEIIRMGDKVITKKEVQGQIEYQLYNTYSLYNMYGYSYDVTDPANIASAQEAVITALKEDLALTAKAKELGLELTAEELEEVKTKAQSDRDSIVANAKTYVEGADSMDEAALTEAAEKLADESGYTLDSYIESYTKTKLDEKLRDYAVKDVTVTDEEIRAEYDSKVAADKETYAEKAGTWATAANNGTTLYYTPAGVRRVKQILTKFKDEDKTAIDNAKQQVTDANTAVTAAQAKIDSANGLLAAEDITEEEKTRTKADLAAAQKELEDANTALVNAISEQAAAEDKAFANLDEEVDAILASLDAEGADWQAIMDEKNQDPGMKNNEKGYAVAADMTSFDAAFVKAAMELEKPGDHSAKVKGTSYGYYIIRYEGDEPEGAIALDAVKESISSSILSTKQTEAYNAAKAQWVEEAGIKVDLNALKD